MCNIEVIGSEWAAEMAGDLTHEIVQMSPVEFNQGHRFLPQSVTKDPGYIDFDRTPYWIEVLEEFDIRSPVREDAILKGVQTAYSTVQESIIFYFAAHVRTVPMIYANATLEMAHGRIKKNYIPMFIQSNMDHIFQSSDTGSTRKQGVTKDSIEWVGGGYMVPRGAQTSAGMTDIAALFVAMDEMDRWPDVKDGDPVELFKDRTTGFTEVRKILMGSTPGLKGASRIEEQYMRGDRRQYYVRCLKCGFPQVLRFSGYNKKTGKAFGLAWDYTSDGSLDIETVRYHCKNCNRAHMEHEKVRLITKDNAFWKKTATPVEPNIRSRQVTGLMSRRSPWYKGVSMWLSAFDPVTKRTKSHTKMQRFYNNFLAESYEIDGGKIRFRSVSAHRRQFYRKGEIPNKHIEQYCATGVLFLTCTVDVHLHHLNVATWGWTAGAGYGFNPWLVDYFQIKDETEAGCESIDSEAWKTLETFIDERVWASDDGKKYRLALTLIDSRYSTATVVSFCQQWETGVFPIMGTDRPAKYNRISEFTEAKTKSGDFYYAITVDLYKDRIAPVLRRTWRPSDGDQRPYTFNAPTDTTDDELKELTREYKREKKWPNGRTTYEWHRPHGAENELWDLLVYGHASVEILAWMICVKNFEMETVEWFQFWEYCKGGVFFEVT